MLVTTLLLLFLVLKFLFPITPFVINIVAIVPLPPSLSLSLSLVP